MKTSVQWHWYDSLLQDWLGLCQLLVLILKRTLFVKFIHDINKAISHYKFDPSPIKIQ